MASRYSDKELDGLKTEELVETLSIAWSENDRDTFVSMFSKEGVVKHPMFDGPTSPSTVMDVLSVNNHGRSIVQNFKVMDDDSHGLVDISFSSHETGIQMKSKGTKEGFIDMSAKICKNRFVELNVGRFKVRAIK